ncbi:MAG: alpha/beta hydrolase [Candidatus Promineofilum sp.]|nr:alpha/beta hydrolase [Promineifilum sp.]
MRTHRRLLIALGATLLVLLIVSSTTLIVLNSRGQAQPEAVAALEPDALVAVSQVAGQDWHVFAPTAVKATTGLILYPGGFVDPVAYAPIARAIAGRGFLVVIDPMPLNLAVTDVSSADAIIAAHPEIAHWAIGGHSLGGAMAAEFVADAPQNVDGLALWAAYPAPNTDLSALPLRVVSIYGDADGVALTEEILSAAQRLPPDAQFILISGGNHTQFGSYGQGLQRGDNPATISRDRQQAAIVAGTVELLEIIGAN